MARLVKFLRNYGVDLLVLIGALFIVAAVVMSPVLAVYSGGVLFIVLAVILSLRYGRT